MRLIKVLLLTAIMFVITTTPSVVNALTSDSLTIRLEQPKTPTNLNDFYITYVALDTQGRDITVACQKQYEGGAVTGFDTTKTLTAGGNTDTCHVTANEFSQKGNYVISVTATAGSDTDSDSVTIDYNNEYPGDPQNYSKNKISNCTYEIKFRSNDDGGKTSKIEVYRSDMTSFTADNGTRVAEINIGSNTDKTITNDVPDCNKTYYYAVRAFSTAGNGSGIVGDKEVKIVDSTSTVVPSPTQAAIPVTSGRSGSILGTYEEGDVGTATEEGRVLGVEGELPAENNETTQPSSTTTPNILRAVAIAVAIFLLIGIIRRRSAK